MILDLNIESNESNYAYIHHKIYQNNKKKQPTSYISTLKIDKFQKTSLDTISGILVTASYCL